MYKPPTNLAYKTCLTNNGVYEVIIPSGAEYISQQMAEEKFHPAL